jgi:hypothetical protein
MRRHHVGAGGEIPFSRSAPKIGKLLSSPRNEAGAFFERNDAGLTQFSYRAEWHGILCRAG